MAIRPPFLPERSDVVNGVSGQMSRPWFNALLQLFNNTLSYVVGPSSAADGQYALFDGTSGKVIKAATGTGVAHATLGVYSVSDVTLAEIVPATAASRLIGRRSGSSGDWEEVSLGTGVSMSASAVLTATGVAYAPMTDGAEPPTLISNGAGQIVMVPYEP